MGIDELNTNLESHENSRSRSGKRAPRKRSPKAISAAQRRLNRQYIAKVKKLQRAIGRKLGKARTSPKPKRRRAKSPKAQLRRR